MSNFYVVPTELVMTPRGERWMPKYIPALTQEWAAKDFGLDRQALVGANVSPAQHTFLAAQSDVLVIPPFDDAVGGNPTLNQVRNRLEQRNIPATWITATTTWRQITGAIGDYTMIVQRLHALYNIQLFGSGVTLDSTLSVTLLERLVSVGASFNPALNTTTLSVTTTVRDALIGLGSQLPSFILMGETF